MKRKLLITTVGIALLVVSAVFLNFSEIIERTNHGHNPQIENITATEPNEVLLNEFEADILGPLGTRGHTFDRLITDYEVNGFAIWIIKNNQVVHKIYKGYEDWNNTRPINKETRFQAASMSKLMGGIAIAQADYHRDLVLTKKIGNIADDHPGSEFEKWRNKNFNNTDEQKFYDIGIKRLMSHSAGFDIHGIGTFEIGKAPTAYEILRGNKNGAIFGDGVTFEYVPGTKLCYSGGGMTAAELALETVTGRTFKNYAKEMVLDAANMTTASLAMADENTPNLAWGCSRERNCFDGRPVQQTKVKIAGGLLATPRDYYRMIYPLYNDGKRQGGETAYPSEIIEKIFKASYHVSSTLTSCEYDTDCEQTLTYDFPFTHEVSFPQTCYQNKCKQLLGFDLFDDDNCSSPSPIDFYGIGTKLRGEYLEDGLHRFFHHGGAQPGFRSDFIIDRRDKDGIIVMINGDRELTKTGPDGITRKSGSDGLVTAISDAWGRVYKPEF